MHVCAHRLLFFGVPCRALGVRDPAVAAVVAFIMRLMIKTDPKIVSAWLPYLWQFCQVFNLFHLKRFKVDLGYGVRHIVILGDLVTEVLQLLDEHSNSDEAMKIIKRYVPAYDAGVSRTVKNPGATIDISPYTLI